LVSTVQAYGQKVNPFAGVCPPQAGLNLPHNVDEQSVFKKNDSCKKMYGVPNTDIRANNSDFRANDSDFGVSSSDFRANNSDFGAPSFDVRANDSNFGAPSFDIGANNFDFGVICSEIGENNLDSIFLDLKIVGQV
jgi:hypothetical protein